MSVTDLIGRARDGDESAEQQLFELVYGELRQLAARRVGTPQRHNTIGVTDLVNEAYLEINRKFPSEPVNTVESRRTFYQSVGLAMATIMRDYARRKSAHKRGGGEAQRVAGPTDVPEGSSSVDVDLFLDLQEVLPRLQKEQPNWYQTVLLRYLAGRSVAETAELMGVSEPAVKKYWRRAKAWLAANLHEQDA